MILVIGANGNIGSQLVKQLLAQGEKVRVLVRDAKKAGDAFGKNVEVATGDISNAGSLDKAFQGVKAAFVLTAGDAILDEKNAFTAAKKAGVGHVVKLSVAGAGVGDPIRLADMHGQSEAALAQSGVSWSVLQPTMFMSNTLSGAHSIKGEGKMYGSFKNGRIPMIDTADIAACAAAILRNPRGHEGKAYYITGPEGLTQAQVAEKIGKVAGRSVSYIDIPSSALVENMKKMGMPAWLAEDFGKMSDWLATDQAAQPMDTVEKITGRAARTFDAWLSDNGAAFK